MEKILITGASGLIGKRLTELLSAKGYEVIHLLRKNPANSKVKFHLWNPDKNELEESAFENIDHVIHLSGENISNKRWTDKQKKILRDSRIATANLLFEKSRNAKLKTFVSASGISLYGTATTENIYDEEAKPTHDFLAQLTVDWEKAADQFSDRGVRVVKIRTSVVLSKKGGALEKILKPIRMGFGSPLGNGKQYFPWIHLEDLSQIYIQAIQDQNMTGAYNAAAPEHCTNRELTYAIAKF
ncbi:MAG: TIGR01777 family protein [Crocinitomicaceae bacterium]|nr:TIGR01777 family protein [Crocinitomicaceae bacterium]